MTAKQQRALAAQEEYVVSGRKEQVQAHKDNLLRHKRAALQVPRLQGVHARPMCVFLCVCVCVCVCVCIIILYI